MFSMRWLFVCCSFLLYSTHRCTKLMVSGSHCTARTLGGLVSSIFSTLVFCSRARKNRTRWHPWSSLSAQHDYVRLSKLSAGLHVRHRIDQVPTTGWPQSSTQYNDEAEHPPFTARCPVIVPPRLRSDGSLAAVDRHHLRPPPLLKMVDFGMMFQPMRRIT